MSGVSKTTTAKVNTAFAGDTITVFTGGKQGTSSAFNVNAQPTDITLANNTIAENQPSGTVIGGLTATDVDAAQTHTFTLPNGGCGPDNAFFQISGTNLQSAQSFNFEADSSYAICIRATDNGTPNRHFNKQFTITIEDQNDAPTVVNDGPYGGVIGNTLAVLSPAIGSGPQVALTGNVLTNNDTDEDATFPHTVSAVAETATSTGGGTATINTDGSFTFLPGVGDKNQDDTFTYHATDGPAQSAGTVTVHIEDFLVWYVNNAGAAGDGRSSSPLNTLGSSTLQGVSDLDGAGDYIFLYQGAGNYTTGIPLESNQKLYGEKHGLTVNGVNLVAAGATAPVIANASSSGVGLASGVDVEGLNVSSTGGDAVNGLGVADATSAPRRRSTSRTPPATASTSREPRAATSPSRRRSPSAEATPSRSRGAAAARSR